MHWIPFILLSIFFLFFALFEFRKQHAVHKVNSLSDDQKLHLLDELLAPFGFTYNPSQDIISTELDAWQRTFGYRSLFDKSAVHFNMVIDCEPVYFDYNGHTWMIELWKGQYGINTGAEIGTYYADRILAPEEYAQAQFHCVPNKLMLPVSMELYSEETLLFSAAQTHWWLTGFLVGQYSRPSKLSMEVSLTFPNDSMMDAYIQALLDIGYRACDIHVRLLTVSYRFSRPHSIFPGPMQRIFSRISQWENRIFCRLYRLITQPFSCTVNRILYLYYFLPFAFRHLLLFRRNRAQKYRPRRDCRWKNDRSFTA